MIEDIIVCFLYVLITLFGMYIIAHDDSNKPLIGYSMLAIMLIGVVIITTLDVVKYKLRYYYISVNGGYKKPENGYIVRFDTIRDIPFIDGDTITYYVKER